MSFIELAKKRYTCRSYKETKVEKAKLDLIIEAGHVAPTAANKQPYQLIVVEGKEGLEKLSNAANIYHAPLAIIIYADAGAAWTRAYDGKKSTDIDASIVTDHMMMEATDLGLASVWICGFKQNIVKKEFNIPDNMEVISILAIGYEADEPQSPDRHSETRKPLNEIVTYYSLDK